MVKRILAFLLIFGLAGTSAIAETPKRQALDASTEHFELEVINSKQAITALRSIGGIRHLGAVDTNTVRITEPKTSLETARQVLRLFDVASGTKPAFDSFVIDSDKSVVGRFVLDS